MKTLQLLLLSAALFFSVLAIEVSASSNAQTVTIQKLIDNCPDGGTINVPPGLYHENLVISRSIAIKGSAAATTIVDGRKNGSVITIKVLRGKKVSLAGLTIRNGVADRGGGIYNTGDLTIKNCIISENSATNIGGGVYNVRGTIDIGKGGIISENSATYGGGVYNINDASSKTISAITLTGGTISKNTAKYDGGGVYNDHGAITLISGAITKNIAGYDGNKIIPGYNGGGIYNKGKEIDGNTSTVRDNINGDIFPYQ